jgi:hypothetical protein
MPAQNVSGARVHPGANREKIKILTEGNQENEDSVNRGDYATTESKNGVLKIIVVRPAAYSRLQRTT